MPITLDFLNNESQKCDLKDFKVISIGIGHGEFKRKKGVNTWKFLQETYRKVIS